MTHILRRPLPAVLLVAAAGCALRAGPDAAVLAIDPLAHTTAAVSAASRNALMEGGGSPPAAIPPSALPLGPIPPGGDAAAAVLPGGGVPAVDAASAAMVDDVRLALAALDERRRSVLADETLPAAQRARTLARLGAWNEAGRIVAAERAAGRATGALVAAEAELLRRRHRYLDAERVVAAGLAALPNDRDLLLARAQLEVDRWTLDAARVTALTVLSRRSDDADALLMVGRINLLAKSYDSALEIAQQLQRLVPSRAGGFLLEADVHFWRENPAAAEAPLRAGLERDPFDPDARFSYGYAIWRRVDARLLQAMADQWNLALTVDPLHYFTHWHYGNGHTNQTYADYALESDSLVRELLKPADSLIARGRPLDAVRASREVERDYPESVLPAMLRGSAFYMAYDMDREARLDSAQATFARILARKRNYGPAHNALAAVIKQRQFTVLAAFDSLEAAISGTPLPEDPAFDSIFVDLRYYPGDRVLRMARQQLGPGVAYLPMLAMQNRRFRVPPLHKDLAEVMERPSFRGSTTFDNRQWMDIRGVGSGAAGIEYVERGSHWERNVLLHEYIHLFHGRAFTEAESRRVRELYWNAMRESRTLDYYAANNESEFLAQAYEAYLSPVKAHPLNHKAMNTRDDLVRKDPATFAFVDSLVKRQEAYMAGDTAVFRSNWSQAYANLADSVRSLNLADSARSARAADSVRFAAMPDGDARRALADTIAHRADTTRAKLIQAAALLDTALRWDPDYVPTMLSYATLRREERRFDDAERWLDRAIATDPGFARSYAARATFIARRAEALGDTGPAVFEEQAALYERALSLETDLADRAVLNSQLRSLYARHGNYADAIRVAEEYLVGAPMVSTYLRDRRDEAAAFAASLRAAAGYGAGTLVFFDSLVPLKPQNWGLRQQEASALWGAGRAGDALVVLEGAQRILRAGAGASGSIASLMAEIRLAEGDSAGARREIDDIIERRTRPSANDRRVVRVLALLGHPDSAASRHATYRDRPDSPSDRAEIAFTRGVIAEARGNAAEAEREYRQAIAEHAYHRHARARLVSLLRRLGRAAEAEDVIQEGTLLPLPLGPDIMRELRAAGIAA